MTPKDAREPLPDGTRELSRDEARTVVGGTDEGDGGGSGSSKGDPDDYFD
ncbi:MAG TPA: hypothetical protein VKU85_19080 [bacterium]|nr:hypothetical protein [bacterium]